MALRFCPRGNSGSRVGTTLAPTPTSRRIKKMLSKGLRSHKRLARLRGEVMEFAPYLSRVGQANCETCIRFQPESCVTGTTGMSLLPFSTNLRWLFPIAPAQRPNGIRSRSVGANLRITAIVSRRIQVQVRRRSIRVEYDADECEANYS